MNKAILKRAARYHTHADFRALADTMRALLDDGRLCQADCYDAVRVAIEMPRDQRPPRRDTSGDGLMDRGGVLTMAAASYTETAALVVISVLWRRRELPTERLALRGWIDRLRRDRKGHVP